MFGVGFPIFIVFLILKLLGIIQWNWWWVTSPLWITGVIVGIVYAAGLTTAGFASIIWKWRRSKKDR